MLEKINKLKKENPNTMVWYRRVLGNDFFLIVSVETRKIVSVETETITTPMSNEEYHELICDIQSALSEKVHKVQEKENLRISIDNFLDENQELSDLISLQIYEENERFYDSPIFGD